jgi:hypothetical protein
MKHPATACYVNSCKTWGNTTRTENIFLLTNIGCVLFTVAPLQ